MNTQVRADAKFLRRIWLAMVAVTLITGAIAAFATVQAMDSNPKACLFFCE